jgi:NAD(P)-dependent dehydrogenase (short-subunit alcohol dehydrogenase family)
MAGGLEGKVAVITGAAGGIGRSLARELAGRECSVVLADINADLLKETEIELRAAGARVVARPIDVRSAGEVRSLIEDTRRDLGRIDYLFNNAGVNVFAEIADTSLEDWNRLIDVNLRGVVHGVHAAYPIMRKQGFGHIINTASVAGLIPTAAEGAYAATKHAIVGLSSALHVEAKSFGVGVSVVCPGLVDTPILRSTKYVNFEPDTIVNTAPEKPIPPQKAAQMILHGVDRNDFYIILTKTVHALWRVNRFAPRTSLHLQRLAIWWFRNARLR